MEVQSALSNSQQINILPKMLKHFLKYLSSPKRSKENPGDHYDLTKIGGVLL